MSTMLTRAIRLLPIVAAAILSACGDHTPTKSEVLSGQRTADISDARNTGAAGFYFLAPISPALANYPGTFDGTRSPIVQVCQWNGSACTGSLVATFSRAASSISVDNAAQLYRADWTTTGLAPGVLYRIRVIDAGVELGHADAQVPAAGQTPASLIAQGIVPLGNSSRLAIRFRLELPSAVNGSPVVTITAPADGTIVPTGSPLVLTATAIDPEQGDIASQIVWRSSQILTPLGTGASISATLPGGRHSITASVTDAAGATTTASIQVVVNILSAPLTLNVPYGGTASLPITLSQPAPTGGLTLTVSSASPTLVGVTTTTVNIAGGVQSANATLQGVAPGSAAITISSTDYGTVTTQAATTASLNITQANVSFPAGRVEPIIISLESGGVGIAAPAGGMTVTLVSANASCVTATSPVTIPAGLVNVTANLTYGGSATTPCTAQVTASVSSVPSVSSDVVSAIVQPAPSITISLSSLRVGEGLRAGLSSISLGAPAPNGGLVVTLSSSSSSVLLVSDGNTASVGSATATVTVPAGTSNALFYAHGVNNASGTATISASASGYSTGTSSVITVAAAAIEILSLPSNTTTLTPPIAFSVRVGVSNVGGTALQTEQEVRPGSANIVVTVSNSSSAVARLVNSAGTAQSRTTTIAMGASRSATTVAAGGVAFEPLGGGATTVNASSTGLIAASQLVTVSAPAFTFSLGATRIGAGLRGGASVITLGAPAPAGGLTVTLASSNSAVLLVSDGNAASVGSATAAINVAAGATSVLFYMHALENVLGSATLSASAPGYTSGTSAAVAVAAPALELLALPSTTTTLTPNITFVIRSGVSNVQGTAFQNEQEARPGGGGITVTSSNSNIAVAQLVNSAGNGQSRTTTIVAGTSRSPTTVAGGGVAFDPLGSGTTTVDGTATGFIAASQLVTVTAPAITFSLTTTRVGAGLRPGASVISLGAPAPAGGLTVMLASTNSSVLLVSDGGIASVGSATATVNVTAGSTTALFYMHGVDAVTGTATMTATAPNFTTGTSATITVAAAAIEFLALPAATTTLTPDVAFIVRSGVSNVPGNGFQNEQEVRPGGGGMVVTVSNSNAAVGQLVTTAGAGQTRTVTIAAGASRSPNTVASGGIAFDPLSTGTTTVGGSAANVVSTSAAVTVSAPTLTMSLSSSRVGAGLRAGLSSITLGAPAPAGGLAITLVSSNSGVLLVSDGNVNSVGAGTATVTAAAGVSNVAFYMHGVEGTSGTVVITASAAGFTNGTTSPTVAAPAVDMLNLPTSVQSTAPSSIVILRVGVSNVGGTAVQAEQEVRPGIAGLVVTVNNSNAAVAQLTTTAGSAQSRTVTIATGTSRSANAVATGGVAFDPLAVGSTSVSTSAVGVISIGPATVTVTP